jgi:hypothetical protein
MKYLELFEGKSVGLLYHYTNPESLISILNDNILKTGNYGWNYFTRNKNYHLKKDLVRDEAIRITIDGNKLSYLNKIEPYSSWVARDMGRHKEKNISKYDEFEERSGNIKNIKNYIISIDLDPAKTWIYFLRKNFDEYDVVGGKNIAIMEHNKFIENIHNMYPNLKVVYLYKSNNRDLFNDKGFISKQKK